MYFNVNLTLRCSKISKTPNTMILKWKSWIYTQLLYWPLQNSCVCVCVWRHELAKVTDCKSNFYRLGGISHAITYDDKFVIKLVPPRFLTRLSCQIWKINFKHWHPLSLNILIVFMCARWTWKLDFYFQKKTTTTKTKPSKFNHTKKRDKNEFLYLSFLSFSIT